MEDKEVMHICPERGVRVEDRHGDEGYLEGTATVDCRIV